MSTKAIARKIHRSAENSDGLNATLFNAFYPGKFMAPRFDPSFHLVRKKAIETVINTSKRVILIEARAGQGKSIFAAQFLHYSNGSFAWLRLDENDRDPVVFISALIASIANSSAVFKQSVLYEMALKGEIQEKEIERLVPTFHQILISIAKNGFYIVIDDLHLVKNSPVVLRFLTTLVSGGPKNLRFILISRSVIDLSSISANALYLDNLFLALTHSDIANLFTHIFKTPLPPETIDVLKQNTEGWMMGVILASHALTDNFSSLLLPGLKHTLTFEPGKFWEYFETEILKSLSPCQRHLLMVLSLLDNIPLELAESLQLVPDIKEFLEFLIHKNYFLSQTEEQPPTYAFHHLFRNIISKRAQQELSERKQQIILAKCGKWYLRNNVPEQALQYYLKARTFGIAERIFRKAGFQLLGANRIAALAKSLSTIPDEIVAARPWLSLFKATIYYTSDPVKCKKFISQANQKFIEKKDALGELYTIAAMIPYHIGVDCDFKQGQTLLPRAEYLFVQLAEDVSVAARIQIAIAIAYGLCYFVGQFERAAEYTTRVIQMAKERGLYQAMAAGLVARGLICSFDGNWRDFKKRIEASFLLLKSPRVSSISKLGLIILQINLLGQEGNLPVCLRYRQEIDAWINPKLILNTIFGSMLTNFDASVAVYEGRFEDAEACLLKGLDAGGSNQSAHVQSLYWGRLAYIYALSGNSSKACHAVKKACDLREKVGGTFFEVGATILKGAVYAMIGKHDPAEKELSTAISEAHEMGSIAVVMTAYAHRALVRMENNRKEEGLRDLKYFLQILKDFEFPSLQLCGSALLKKLFAAAVAENIQPVEAVEFAKKFLRLSMTPEGDPIPLLEINTLGVLEIKIEGKVKITFGELTKNQRELMALLISASSANGIPHSVLHEAFWPASSAEKMRSKLDNLYARLRRVFNTCLAPCKAHYYLSMEKGHMCLRNCIVDANQFRDDVRNGIRHMKKFEFWQASNAFLRAALLYQGEFLPGVHLNDPAAYYRDELQTQFILCARNWGQILLGSGNPEEAIQICRKALQYEPTNEDLVRFVYRILMQNNDAVKAKKTLSDYQKALAEDGFSTRDIKEIMTSFAL